MADANKPAHEPVPEVSEPFDDAAEEGGREDEAASEKGDDGNDEISLLTQDDLDDLDDLMPASEDDWDEKSFVSSEEEGVQIESEQREPGHKPAPLEEVSSDSVWDRVSGRNVLLTVLIILIGLGGGVVYKTGFSLTHNPLAAIMEKKDSKVSKGPSENRAVKGNLRVAPANKHHSAQKSTEFPDALPSVVTKRLEEAEQLRQRLLTKNEEIKKLRNNYVRGVEEIEQDILKDIRKMENKALNNALEDSHIGLGLRTIQRRQAYTAQLDTISGELIEGSEELLYLNRRARILSALLPMTGALDTTSFSAHIHSVAQTHAVGMDNIVFDSEGYPLEPLAAIWNRITAQYAANLSDDKKSEKNTEEMQRIKREKTIIDQVCSGSFNLNHLITALSEKGAECLSKWKGTDLTINGVTSLSPEAAYHLSRWKGKWLSLNGLSELSPATAEYLFQWEGLRISLNGVTRLSPEVSKYVPEWKGKHLEIAGLTELTYDVAEDLIRWKEAGGTVYVSERFKR